MRKLTMSEAADLISLQIGVMKQVVADSITRSLRVVGPHVTEEDPWVFICPVSLSTHGGGVADSAAFSLSEVEMNAGRVADLVRMRAEQVGESMRNGMMDHGSRMLSWARAGRLRRLWWAWRGAIPG